MDASSETWTTSVSDIDEVGHRIGGGAAVAGASIEPLLRPDEPSPWTLENAEGQSDIVLVCEHAGALLPQALGTLGLDGDALQRHFMWDIGALDLARALAARCDAPLAHQRYSRMVCDCNRRPSVPSFIPEQGEGLPVPGNRELSDADRQWRRAAIWQPFHDALSEFLQARESRARRTILISIHTFTPVFFGEPRPWQVGVLFDRDPLFSPRLHAHLVSRLGNAVVGCNEPYAMSRHNDYTIPVHAEDRGLVCAEIEVRNDLLGDRAAVTGWADRLAEGFAEALGSLGENAAAS